MNLLSLSQEFIIITKLQNMVDLLPPPLQRGASLLKRGACPPLNQARGGPCTPPSCAPGNIYISRYLNPTMIQKDN